MASVLCLLRKCHCRWSPQISLACAASPFLRTFARSVTGRVFAYPFGQAGFGRGHHLTFFCQPRKCGCVSLCLIEPLRHIHRTSNRRHPTSSPLLDRQTYLDSISKSHVVVTIKDLDQLTRYRGHSVLGWGLLVLGALCFGVYMFREPIKENLSDEVADVASRSMGDENVILKAHEISTLVLRDLLKDPATQETVSDFVVGILGRPDIKKAAFDLTGDILNDPGTATQAANLAGRALVRLLEHEETRTVLLGYLRSLLLDPEVRTYCREFVDGLLGDEQTKQVVADFFRDVLSSKTVLDQALTVGKSVTQGVVTDQEIQKQTSVAMLNAASYAFVPSWWPGKKM